MARPSIALYVDRLEQYGLRPKRYLDVARLRGSSSRPNDIIAWHGQGGTDIRVWHGQGGVGSSPNDLLSLGGSRLRAPSREHRRVHAVTRLPRRLDDSDAIGVTTGMILRFLR